MLPTLFAGNKHTPHRWCVLVSILYTKLINSAKTKNREWCRHPPDKNFRFCSSVILYTGNMKVVNNFFNKVISGNDNLIFYEVVFVMYHSIINKLF